MNTSGSEIKIIAGNSSKELAQKIADYIGVSVLDCEVGTFSDGEICVNMNETVRGCDVFVVQSTNSPVNDNLMELLILIDALKRASAGRITAVIPYYGYARQDRKAKARDPITAKLVANLITAAGADRVLTMDLHAAQIQGYFDIPLDHLLGGTILANAAECEPLLAHNIKEIEERPEIVYQGIKYAMEVTNAGKGMLAIKSKHPKAIEAFKKVIKPGDNIEVAELVDMYPMGEERAIVRDVLGKLLEPTQIGRASCREECRSRWSPYH